MPFSKSLGYAIRALVRLAEDYADKKKRWLASDLAESSGMPASYLSKVLSELSDGGLIDSARGRGGGVRLAHHPSSITLYDVAKVTDGFDSKAISLPGWEDAPREILEPLLRRWRPYHMSLLEFLSETTIDDLLRDRKSTAGSG